MLPENLRISDLIAKVAGVKQHHTVTVLRRETPTNEDHRVTVATQRKVHSAYESVKRYLAEQHGATGVAAFTAMLNTELAERPARPDTGNVKACLAVYRDMQDKGFVKSIAKGNVQ